MTNLLQQINAIISQYGCTATEITEAAVNVMGDSRSYLPAVIVRFPSGMSWGEIGKISTEITNKVRVSRILMEIVDIRDERLRLIGLIRSRFSV